MSKLNKILLGFALNVLSVQAHAGTVVASDGDMLSIDISQGFPTRLVFEHDKGSKFIFNTIEGETPDLDLTLGESGDVFVTVLQGKIGESVGGFLTTGGGRTYMVDFNIRDMRQEEVMIVNHEARVAYDAAKAKRAGSSTQSNLKPVKWARSSGHHQSLGTVVTALFNGQVMDGFASMKRAKLTPNVPGLVMDWEFGFTASNLMADRYLVTNDSLHVMLLEERRAEFGEIVAFSSSKTSLKLGESAAVYIVRKIEGGK